jgi:hypothetical protein
MKRYSLTRDPETSLAQAEVLDRGERYPLRHIPFQRPHGFDLDACRPGTADLAIAILADWFGEHPSDPTFIQEMFRRIVEPLKERVPPHDRDR